MYINVSPNNDELCKQQQQEKIVQIKVLCTALEVNWPGSALLKVRPSLCCHLTLRLSKACPAENSYARWPFNINVYETSFGNLKSSLEACWITYRKLILRKFILNGNSNKSFHNIISQYERQVSCKIHLL